MGRELTVRQIADKYAITTNRLLIERARKGWPKRSRACATRTSPATAGAPGKVELAERLMKTIDRKLKQMESRMTKGDGSDASPAESERDARALANLTRTLDQAAEMIAVERDSEGRSGPEAGGSGLETTSDDKTGDALRLRRELAERIERLGRRSES